MIIDYCSGGDLSLLLAQLNNFNEQQARFYIAELLLSIENLHQMDVVYRDLKPENILLDEEGHIKLADFGLSRENIKVGEVAKSFCGSPIYLSPEVAKNEGFTHASDIYGIGLVLYEMLFGTPPFYTEEIPKLYAKIKKMPLTFPNEPEASDQAKDLLIKMLMKDPKERIGANDKQEIKDHPFFAGINWKDVEMRKLPPPFVDEDDESHNHRKRLRINDKDYTKDNYSMMRISAFDFVRDEEIDGKIKDSFMRIGQ